MGNEKLCTRYLPTLVPSNLRKKREDKFPSLQWQQHEYSFPIEALQELFDGLVEYSFLTLPELTPPEEVGMADDP